MASITKSKTGVRRILFYDADKSRKSIHLGKCSARDAEKIKTRVESLLAAKILGRSMDQDDATWLANEGKYVRPKLEVVGLAPQSEPIEEKPKSRLLSELLTEFMEKKSPGKKPGTIGVWVQIIDNLKNLMPEGIRIDEVTAGHADAFHDALKAKGMKSSTIHKRISFSKQIFRYALRFKWITENPFAEVRTPNSSTKSNVEVPRDVVQRVIDIADPTWQLIIALSRFGGLRCPSEVLSLKWADIDWQRNRMHIPEPKVEHHEGRGVRSCPIFPELVPYLRDAWEKGPTSEYVVDKQAYRDAADTGEGWKNANLRTQLLKLIAKANVQPWARIFHSMRASRQTELEHEHPTHVVCAWLGNSVAVAKKSYLLVTEEDYSKASSASISRGTNPTRADSFCGTNGALQGARTGNAGDDADQSKTSEISVFPAISLVQSMDDTGLEPATPTMSTWCSNQLS